MEMVKDQVIRMGINDQTGIHKIVSSIEVHSDSEYSFLQGKTHTHTPRKNCNQVLYNGVFLFKKKHNYTNNKYW
jgi:hypothetical protein